MADKKNQKKSPLQIVNDEFGGKAKLLEKLEAFTGEDLWLGRTSKERRASPACRTRSSCACIASSLK
jgi:hypothetical protein